MPDSTKAMHPSGQLGITFTEDDHSYVDDDFRDYVSTTTLIHRHFPAFNAEENAARCAARDGVTTAEVLQLWEQNRDAASLAGTRAHQNAERQFLGEFSRLNQPVDDVERDRFAAVWDKVEDLQKLCQLGVEPEKLVFSPRFLVAGSIDIFGKIAPKKYLLGDWKFTREITRDGHGRLGTSIATSTVPDANFYRYALQLNIYEMILRLEGYVEPDASVQRTLFHYRAAERCFDEICVPELVFPALSMMAMNVTTEGLDHIPF